MLTMLGLQAFATPADEQADLVIGTRLALLSQPEFNDPSLIRELFAAVEEGERLATLLDRVLIDDGVSVTLGEQLEQSGLRNCALVAAPYGGDLGVLGVIGPSRMDYGRVVSLVDYCSELVTERLQSGETLGTP